MSSVPASPAIYVRISSDPGNGRAGVERQKTILTARAAELGWGSPVIYEDNDKSSKVGVDRPDFNRLTADLHSGTRDGLLVYKIDRFSREPSDYDVLKSAAKPVATAYRTFDPSTSDGMKSLRDEAAAAEYETKKLSERLLDQRDQAAQAGTRHGKPAFGWGVMSKKGKWKKRNKVNPEQATLIRSGMDRVLEGASLAVVMREWEASGVKPLSGAAWNTASVRSVLERWSNAGVRQHRGEPLRGVETTWEPICDVPTLEAVRAVLSNNPRQTTSTRARRHLLTGVLRCGCGDLMKPAHVASSARMSRDKTTETGEKYPTHYKCVGMNCGRSVPYDDANEYIVASVAHHLKWLNPHSMLPEKDQNTITSLTTELQALEQRRENIFNADIDENDALVLLGRLRKERELVRVQLDQFASQNAQSALLASLRGIVETSEDGKHVASFDVASENVEKIKERFLALDLGTKKHLLTTMGTYTVLKGFSEPDEKGKRRKLPARERISVHFWIE